MTLSEHDAEKLLAECRERLGGTPNRIDWRLLAVLTVSGRVEYGRIARVAATGAYIVLRGGSAPKLTVPLFSIRAWDWTREGIARLNRSRHA